MAIELITGLPGHGKTLYAIERYRGVKRQVYYHGIKEVRLPWIQHDPLKWQELPEGAIFIIDESQFVFPLRGRGEPDEWISRLAVHRHQGIDFVLITQDPMLIDSFVRRLCDRHMHVVRKFGTKFATIHEYANGVREMVSKSRGDSIRHEWRYPQDVFALYKSAELHTVKTRIPARVFMLGALVIGLPVLGWVIWHTMLPSKGITPTSTPADAQAKRAVAGAGDGASSGHTTTAQYLQLQVPRVAGLSYTAPVYDKVTEPVDAPYPAAVVASASRCKAYSQQGTVLSMPDDLCRRIAADGFFVAWKRAEQPRTEGAGAKAPVAAPPVQDSGLAVIGSGATRAAVVDQPAEPIAPSRQTVRAPAKP